MFNRISLLLGVMAVLFLGAPLAWADDYRSECDSREIKSDVEELKNRGKMTDPKIVDYLGSELVFHSSNGCANSVRFLLQLGLNPNVPDSSFNEFALLVAVDDIAYYYNQRREMGCREFRKRITGKLAVVRALLKAGANPNQIGDDGDTALHIAAENKFWDAVHLLLKAGADPDAMNDSGETAREKIRPNQKRFYIDKLSRSSNTKNDCLKE